MPGPALVLGDLYEQAISQTYLVLLSARDAEMNPEGAISRKYFASLPAGAALPLGLIREQRSHAWSSCIVGVQCWDKSDNGVTTS